MIISASRRTDIPSYYTDWFFNRLKEGFVLVRNPMNFHQVSRINLSPDIVDGIVFWTKNPIPLVERLNKLKKFMLCFQFTITGYGRDIEENVPDKNNEVIPAFRRISEIIGADRLIWRYDPIFINSKYSIEYHIRAFMKIAKSLYGYTQKITISFMDNDYRCVRSNLKKLNLLELNEEQQRFLCGELAKIAQTYNMSIETCAEKLDLSDLGIGHARCIDNRIFERPDGRNLEAGKDKNQRSECRCAASIDIGAYNTCRNGCLYCYANYNFGMVQTNSKLHNPQAPLLFGEIGDGDKIHERVIKKL